MQSIKQSTQRSLDTTRAGGHEKPEVLMEENNLTWETSFTVQGIYYSPRAWENGYDIKKAQSLVLCWSSLPRPKAHTSIPSWAPATQLGQKMGQPPVSASSVELKKGMFQKWSMCGILSTHTIHLFSSFLRAMLVLLYSLISNNMTQLWNFPQGFIRCCTLSQQLEARERQAICIRLVKSVFL